LILLKGNSRKNALPTISSLDNEPQTRESELAGLLSPITKYSSFPKDISDLLCPIFSMYGSFNSNPFGDSSFFIKTF